MSMSLPGILVVEDEAAQRALIADFLRQEGYPVQEAEEAGKALEILQSADCPALVLSDWKLPGMSGGELLAQVRERQWPVSFIVMTAYGSIAHAMEAIRMGADDYLAKPFERDALLIAIRRVLKTSRLEAENRRLRQQIDDQEGFGAICGRAGSMQVLFRAIQKVAATDATVLISGESGTGKELVARTLHEQSPRSAGPFVAINCAAIPETLMESELFGYEKGAFTGADRRRAGKLEEADGGTLFLDEIASMPLPLQAVLLRALQERRFTRVGGRGESAFDTRIVAASNRPLQQLVAEGSFREDLYYRLNVVPLRIPPVRERQEDIPLLVNVFLDRVAERYRLPRPELPSEVLRLLMNYSWPGNVRELANVVERLVLLSDQGVIRPEELPEEILHPAAPAGPAFRLPPDGLDWDQLEASLLRQALDRAAGNRTHAARLLGMSYKTFLYRLEKHNL